MSDLLAESYTCCRRLARRTARNFFYSFAGLPHPQFQAMCVLYAYMRVCDDLGDDESRPVADRAADIDNWESVVRLALSDAETCFPSAIGAAPEWRDRLRLLPALVDTVKRFQLPQQYLLDVLNGIRADLSSDAGVCRYRTFAELEQYCYLVAGVVGLCCIHIWGFHDERAKQRAVDCGLAFQLTNILRDLAADANDGRVYLPSEDLDRFGYSVEEIRQRRRGTAFERLMEFQVNRAKAYYTRAQELFDYIEPAGRPVLRAMLRIYGGVLGEIERRTYDVYSKRISLPTWRKLLIAADAAIRQRLL